MKKKIYKYPTSLTIKDEDEKVVFSVLTKFYQIRIYVGVYYKDNSMPKLFFIEPNKMAKFMKDFAFNNLTPKYTLKLGPEIEVQEIDGLWVIKDN